jgi:hypothetical protein
MNKYSWSHPLKYYPLEQYHSSIEQVSNFLREQGGVRSIYQIGNLTDPGISDVDMLIVFEDDAQLSEDPRQVLDSAGNYLFTHCLFGCKQKHLKDLQRYSFVHNNKFIWGAEQGNLSNVGEMNKMVKESLALEFLVKLYISLSVQKNLRLIKLRSLLLEAKAVKFDLEIFQYGSDKLAELVEQIIEWRSKWFEKQPSESELNVFFDMFYLELEKFLVFLAQDYPLFTLKKSHELSHNILLKHGSEVKWKSHYPPLHFLRPFFKGKELILFKIMNKLANYELTFPFSSEFGKDVLMERDAFYRQYCPEMAKDLPGFIPLKSSLNLNY